MDRAKLLDSFFKLVCSGLLIALPGAFAQASRPVMDFAHPPTPPVYAERRLTKSFHVVRPLRQVSAMPLSGPQKVFLPLSAGYNLISIPLRTSSRVLSDLFPNLPEGSHIWLWDSEAQEFKQDMSEELPFGEACWIYLPRPFVVSIVGEDNVSSSIPVEVRPGWNLIGVPYEAELGIGEQYLWVAQVRESLGDGMALGHIGKVSTIDANGTYSDLSGSDAFSPNHGYWVYSTGNYLLQLRTVSLGTWAEFGVWSAKSLGSGVLGGLANMGLSHLMTMLGGDATASALAHISDQLDQVEQEQQQIQQSLASLSSQLNYSVEDLKATIGDATYVGPVREKIEAHYDAATPGSSLTWFKQQAASVALAANVTQATKTQFATDVLRTWDVPSLFVNVKLAILGSGGTSGVIDTFANKIVLSGNQYTLSDRYQAMQTYFSELINLQVKCGELITESYNQLAADPSTSANYSTSNAVDWYNNVFQPALQTEYQYFGQVAERIVLSQLTMPSKPGDPAVVVPKEAQLILGYADFMIMNALSESEGLRVHVAVSPDMTMPTTATVTPDKGATTTYTLPDAGQWRTVAGTQEYDSWRLLNNSRQLNITSNWKIAKKVVSGYAPGTALTVAANFEAEPVVQQTVTATVQKYDTRYNVATTGSLFGSVMLAARPDANSMLNPCKSNATIKTGVNNVSAITTSPSASGAALNPCDTLQLTNTTSLAHSAAWVQIPFAYAGKEPKANSFFANAVYKGCGNFGLQLFDGDKLVAENFAYTADAWLRVPSLTWTPGHSYSFKMYLEGGSRLFGSCSHSLQYRNVLMAPTVH